MNKQIFNSRCGGSSQKYAMKSVGHVCVFVCVCVCMRVWCMQMKLSCGYLWLSLVMSVSLRRGPGWQSWPERRTANRMRVLFLWLLLHVVCFVVVLH